MQARKIGTCLKSAQMSMSCHVTHYFAKYIKSVSDKYQHIIKLKSAIIQWIMADLLSLNSDNMSIYYLPDIQHERYTCQYQDDIDWHIQDISI